MAKPMNERDKICQIRQKYISVTLLCNMSFVLRNNADDIVYYHRSSQDHDFRVAMVAQFKFLCLCNKSSMLKFGHKGLKKFITKVHTSRR